MAKKKQSPETPSGYFFQSSRPFPSLVFILPMMLAYEGAILALGADAVHNGAAVWLQNLLEVFGLGQYVLLPLLTCALLLGWHYMLRQGWKFSPSVLAGMWGECIAWALLLWAIYRGYGALVGIRSNASFDLAEMLGYFGAGIYEELLFRVILLAGIAAIVRAAGAKDRASLITAILISSLLFAAAHYDVFVSGGNPFTWAGIAFHFLCGIFLGTLFSLRGFGITAGTHAFYNILLVLLK